jgi:putative aldouronate transport system substrate-binding protein
MDLDTFSYHYGTWTDPETFQYYYGSTLGDTSLAYFSEAHPQYYLPTLSYLPEEQEEITDIQILWPELVLEWTMNFITGALDPNDDAAWQSYVDEMNNQGLETYLEMAQTAYERTVNYQAIAG